MIRKLRKNKLYFVEIILVLGSLVILFLNQGLHFAYYKNEIRVKVEKIEDFDKILDLKNISSLNRSEQKVSIQNETRSSVDEQIQKIGIENAEVNEVVVNSDFEEVSLSLINTSLLILIAGILSIYYFIFRNKLKNFDLREISKLTGKFALDYMILTVGFTGLLSLLSRIYSVRDIDLYSIIILNIFSILFFALFLTENLEDRIKEESIISKVGEFIRPLRVITVVLILIIFATLVFSLGIKFVIPGVLLISAITLASFGYFFNYETAIATAGDRDESDVKKSKVKSSSKRKFQKRNKKKGK
jgi:hypothetical protein